MFRSFDSLYSTINDDEVKAEFQKIYEDEKVYNINTTKRITENNLPFLKRSLRNNQKNKK